MKEFINIQVAADRILSQDPQDFALLLEKYWPAAILPVPEDISVQDFRFNPIDHSAFPDLDGKFLDPFTNVSVAMPPAIMGEFRVLDWAPPHQEEVRI